jgi:NADH-quinone oxidoreductase subunit F
MKMKAGPIDSSGRPSPVATGESYEIPCDTLVVAVGERVDPLGAAQAGIETEKDGRLVADHFTFRTANPKFYAAGDAVTGPATAAEAMGQAKLAAAAIDEALVSAAAGAAAGTSRFESLFRRFDYAMEIPLEPAGAKMNRARRVPPEERRGNFIEISLGYSGEQARIEAERCLRCDVRERARKPIGAGAAGAAEGRA